MGSDFPVEEVNPLLGIYAAVTRKQIRDEDSKPWFPEQIITLHQALNGFTVDGAYASFMEDQIDSISTHKKADYVVFDSNFIDNFSAKKLLTTKVKATGIDGKAVYGSLAQ